MNRKEKETPATFFSSRTGYNLPFCTVYTVCSNQYILLYTYLCTVPYSTLILASINIRLHWKTFKIYKKNKFHILQVLLQRFIDKYKFEKLVCVSFIKMANLNLVAFNYELQWGMIKPTSKCTLEISYDSGFLTSIVMHFYDWQKNCESFCAICSGISVLFHFLPVVFYCSV